MGQNEEKSLEPRSKCRRIARHLLTALQRSSYRLVLLLLQQPLAFILPNYPTKLFLTQLRQSR